MQVTNKWYLRHLPLFLSLQSPVQTAALYFIINLHVCTYLLTISELLDRVCLLLMIDFGSESCSHYSTLLTKLTNICLTEKHTNTDSVISGTSLQCDCQSLCEICGSYPSQWPGKCRSTSSHWRRWWLAGCAGRCPPPTANSYWPSRCTASSPWHHGTT